MRLCVILPILLLLPGLAVAAGNAEEGRKLASNCLGCHGVNGYSNVYPTFRVPRLGGQHADYIVASLEAYKKGERPHATMHAQAATLTPEQMADLAAFFSNHNGKGK